MNLKENLNSKKYIELVQIAKKLNVKYSSSNKEQLISKLLEDPKSRRKIEGLLNPKIHIKVFGFIFKYKIHLILTLIAALITIFSTIIFPIYTSINFIEKVEKFKTEDSTILKLALLPFSADINNNNLDINYRKQINEYIFEKKSTDGIQIKNFFEKCEKDCPQTEEEVIHFGNKINADLIIWGSYEESNSGVKKIRIRFNLLNSFRNHILKQKGDTGTQPINDLAELRDGYLQSNIEFIIHWIIGMSYYKKIDYANAIDQFEIIEQNLLTDSLEKEIYLQLGNLNYSFGKFNKALHYYNFIYEKHIVENNFSGLELVNYFINKSSILIALDSISMALSTNNNALSVLNKQEKIDTNLLLRIYNIFGIAHMKENDTTNSDIYFNMALKIYEDINDTLNPKYPIILKNLGGSYLPPHRKQFEKGRDILEKAVYIEEKILDKNSSSLAISYLNLGTAYFNLKEYDIALDFFYKSEKIFKKINPSNPDLGVIYNSIGTVYASRGESKKGLDFFKKSLIITEANLKESSKKNFAIATTNVGIMAYLSEEADTAIQYLSKALIMQEELYKDSLNYYRLLAQNYLAYSYNMNLKFKKAKNLLEKSLKGINQFLPVDQIDFYSQLSFAYHELKEKENAEKYLSIGKNVCKENNIYSANLLELDSILNSY